MARHRSSFADFLLALALVALADVALFHFGAYLPLLQPESYSGRVEWRNRRLGAMIDASPGVRRVVVVGNSMAEAGVRESQLEAELAGGGRRVEVINHTIGGSSPRSWYILLRNSRVSGDNTEMVVLVIHNALLRATRETRNQDVEIAKTRATIADAFALAGAHRDLESRLRVVSGVVFRTLLFADDVRQYLSDPARRHQQLAGSRARLEHWLRDGVRIDNRSHEDMLSARLGPDGRLVFDELDDFLKSNANVRNRAERLLRQRQETRQAMARGHQRLRNVRADPGKLSLLGRLVQDMNREGIRVVFSVVPVSPYSLDRPSKIDPVADLVRDLKQRGADVEIWHDRRLLRRLQSPAYYRDTLHVNAEGAEIYTRGLGRFLASVLKIENTETARPRPG